YDDGLTPSVMDFEETFPSSSIPWRSDDGPPFLYLGFAGSRELVAASWRVAGRRLRAAAARRLADREAREYWRTRHDIIYVHDEVAPGVRWNTLTASASRSRTSWAMSWVRASRPHAASKPNSIPRTRSTRGKRDSERRLGRHPSGAGLSCESYMSGSFSVIYINQNITAPAKVGIGCVNVNHRPR